MKELSRRDFLRSIAVAAGSAVVASLSGCVAEAEPPDPVDIRKPTPMLTEEMSQLSSSLGAGVAPPTPPVTTQSEDSWPLMNDNREGFYVRYYMPFEPVDVAAWALSVEGAVRAPQHLSLEDIQALPITSQKSRLKCVEGWSAAAAWKGFRPQVLTDIAQPRPEATWVHFYCADDYYESLSLSELTMDRVLFAYGMNGALLIPEYGSPLRLIVPFKYGYKGPKAITRIVFADKELPGYWSTVGTYPSDGQVRPGMDLALDLDTYREFKEPGELFYNAGLESQNN
jgi:methionine sulfoxide reductase catalytic subunit